MERWGLDYESLSGENPGLIMLRISGYGQSGPLRDRTGYGVVAEAMGGFRYITGEPGQRPVRPGVSIGDSLSALHGVIGIMMALYNRLANRSEEHTSELQSLMRSSYAVFCLKKKQNHSNINENYTI